MKQDRHNAFRVVKLTGEVSEAVFNEAKHNLISEEHPKLGPWSWSSDTVLFIRAENSSGNGMVPCVMKAVVMQLFWLFVEDKSRWFSIPSATSNGIHLLWFPPPQAPFPLSSSSFFFWNILAEKLFDELAKQKECLANQLRNCFYWLNDSVFTWSEWKLNYCGMVGPN